MEIVRSLKVIVLVMLMLFIRPSSTQSTDIMQLYIEVEVRDNGWGFIPDEIIIIANTQMEVTYNNTDSVPHDFNIDRPNENPIHFGVFPLSSPTVNMTFNLEPGVYEFYCALPGHREVGMNGTALVFASLNEYSLYQETKESRTNEVAETSYPYWSGLLVLPMLILARKLKQL